MKMVLCMISNNSFCSWMRSNSWINNCKNVLGMQYLILHSEDMDIYVCGLLYKIEIVDFCPQRLSKNVWECDMEETQRMFADQPSFRSNIQAKDPPAISKKNRHHNAVHLYKMSSIVGSLWCNKIFSSFSKSHTMPAKCARRKGQ